MKHDHSQFAAAAYGGQDIVADRVRRFVPMVRKAAWHIYGSGRDGLEVDDLMQAGFIALTECARNHDGPGEDGFAAYAKIRVRGAMFDVIRKMMPESRGQIARRRKAEDAQDRLRQRLGREPSADELAAELGIAPGDLGSFFAEGVHLTPMDAAYDDSNTAFASSDPDPFALLCEMEDGERLGVAMERLSQRLQLVLQLYFVEELNLTEIAEVLEVSVPRVHQLKAEALVKLRDMITAD